MKSEEKERGINQFTKQKEAMETDDDLFAELLAAEMERTNVLAVENCGFVVQSGAMNSAPDPADTNRIGGTGQLVPQRLGVDLSSPPHGALSRVTRSGGQDSNVGTRQWEAKDTNELLSSYTTKGSGCHKEACAWRRATYLSDTGGNEDELLIETLLQLANEKISSSAERESGVQPPSVFMGVTSAASTKGSGQVVPASSADPLDGAVFWAALPSGPPATTAGVASTSAQSIGMGAGPRSASSIAPQNGHCQENDAQVLTAVLDALADGQSSVSGDFLSEEDCNMDELLERAEHVAASAIRVEGKKGVRLVRIHEHVGMREELHGNREIVGWPSCVCARPSPFDKNAQECTKTVSPPAPRRVTLCVGTTLGFVLLFDERRRPIGKFGPPNSILTTLSKPLGAVVSISLSHEASTMAVGYQHGTVKMVEASSLSTLREVTDEFTAPIIRLRHCQEEAFRILALGSCGSIKLLSFSRVLGMMSHRVVKVASPGGSAPFSDVDLVFMKEDRVHVVAAASFEVLVVLAVDCGAQGVVTPLYKRKQQTKGTRHHLQLQFVPVPLEHELLLCLVQNTDVEVFRVANGCVVTDVQKITGARLERSLRAMTHMDSCCLFLDEDNFLHLFDVSAGVVVESQQMHELEPAYFSTDGRTNRCNAALTCSGRNALILGRTTAFSCTLMSWWERLDDLVSKNRFLEALDQLKDFALNVALAVSGLESDPVARRTSIHAYLSILANKFLAYILKTANSTSFIVGSITCLIKACADVDAMHVFFDSSMVYLRDAKGSDALALYALGHCINSGVVTFLPEAYVEPLFTLLADDESDIALEVLHTLTTQGEGEPLHGVSRAERVLMKLEGGHECLLPLSEKYNLVRLKVFILCRWHHGYADALQYALREWRRVNKVNGRDNEVAVDLFECTMRGATVMDGVYIPEQCWREAKGQMWRHLLNTPGEFEALLRVNAERVVMVTLPILQESGPYSPWSNPEERDDCAAQLLLHLAGVDFASGKPFRPWELVQRDWPPYSVVQQLFAGIIHLVLGGAVVLTPVQLFFDHACTHLIYQFQMARDNVQRRSAQTDVIALLTSPHMEGLNFAFVEAALHQQRMGRALAELHYIRGELAEAIECYLCKEYNRFDATLAKDVFNFIWRVSRIEGEGKRERSRRLRDAVMHHIAALADADPTALARFVFEHLRDDHEEVMSIIRKSSKTFLRYIDELVAKAEPKVLGDVMLQNAYIGLLCSEDPERVYPYMRAYEAALAYDCDTVLCSMKKYKVIDAAVYLLEKRFRVEEAVEVLMDAITSKLHEVQLELIREVQSPEMRNGSFVSGSAQRKHSSPQRQTIRAAQSGSCEEALQHVVRHAVDLCARHYAAEEARSYKVWMTLFGHFASPQKSLGDCLEREGALQESGSISKALDERNGGPAEFGGSTKKSGTPLSLTPEERSIVVKRLLPLFTDYASYILMCMIKVLNLADVITFIVGSCKREGLKTLESIISRTVGSLRFECEVNEICNDSLQQDAINLSREHYRRLNMGVMPVANMCYVCGGDLNFARGVGAETAVRIYACGHAYHEKCIVGVASEHLGNTCIQCSRSRSGVVNSSALNMGVVQLGEGIPGNVGPNQRGCHLEEEEQEGGEAAEVDNPQVILRRLRQTRAKMSWSRECRNRIQSFLRKKCGEQETLSMAPTVERPLVVLPGVIGTTSAAASEEGPEALPEVDNALPMTLTDEEVLELFDT